MIELIAKLGISAGIGFLIGLLAIGWIEPTTGGGSSLIMLTALVFSISLGGLISKVNKKSKQKSKRKIWLPSDDYKI